MNDDILEQQLRELPAPELPERWQAEILSNATRAARSSSAKPPAWPPLLLMLHNVFARNPLTAGALTALWTLILLFKASTPIDPSEKELIAHFDPNRPVYLVSLEAEIQLAQLWQDQPEPRQLRRIP